MAILVLVKLTFSFSTQRSWGSGANPWGHDRECVQFATPNHYDGMLEVVGVSGVIHLGQIQSGFRNGIRIAQVGRIISKISLNHVRSFTKKCGVRVWLQGGHIKIHLNVKTPIQIDGEPTRFGPGEIVILKSALKVSIRLC